MESQFGWHLVELEETRPQAAPTLEQVAALAGVSRATVSRVGSPAYSGSGSHSGSDSGPIQGSTPRSSSHGPDAATGRAR